MYFFFNAHLIKFRDDNISTLATGPVPTITSGIGGHRPSGAAHALGVLQQINCGFNQGDGNDARHPVITDSGRQQRQVTIGLAQLSPAQEVGALHIAACT